MKTKAFFSRYQVKFRRRREGKTDYTQRRALVVQAKNKYNAARNRLVVRFTNKYVICQIVYSTIAGDRVLAAAYSWELPRYGLKTGLKNYAAAYCTGLLVARRVLTKLSLNEKYPGAEEVSGEIPTIEDEGRTFYVEDLDEDKRPLRCVLDVGVRPTTRGARLMGALKGASDGGLDIPHSEKRFPGYDAESKEYNADAHRARIFGGHIKEHMNELQEEDAEAYEKHFSQYIKAGVSADDLEQLFENVHKAIRADPSAKAKTKVQKHTTKPKPARRSLAQRKDRVRQKKAAHAKRVAEGRA